MRSISASVSMNCAVTVLGPIAFGRRAWRTLAFSGDRADEMHALEAASVALDLSDRRRSIGLCDPKSPSHLVSGPNTASREAT